MSAIQAMASTLLAPYPPVAIHEREEETQDSELTHARGFPGLGPPTLCGEGEAPEDVPTVVTCPACVALSHDVQALADRAERLAAADGRSLFSILGPSRVDYLVRLATGRAPAPCPGGCTHTDDMHRAFDEGLAAGEGGQEDICTYTEASLLEQWQNGYAIGTGNRQAGGTQ